MVIRSLVYAALLLCFLMGVDALGGQATPLDCPVATFSSTDGQYGIADDAPVDSTPSERSIFSFSADDRGEAAPPIQGLPPKL
jgi:hypothetical protein